MPREETPDLPGFHVIGDLYTDDPHWRRATVFSVLLSALAGAGARRAHGPVRVVLTLAAVVFLLPALSLALLVGIALLLRRLGDDLAQAGSSLSSTRGAYDDE
jgi:hypothetical protein